ncbi:protein phosphatase CheZ [Lysobacter sp. LF1]|uniref:Protein phosphatase CheZ n=1 Tax=Lysobacter stagni TaxID=3045172 RepID=A0ABT6XBA6_9GAMM|nr:protein phosphatase CheZ [Lysobacter sp. LF1]MDI9237427.1 protein phosphatase CheZ [Lysobacter sp. LF1]
MTDASCGKAFPDDRQAVIARLHAALWALEHDDLAGWRTNVDALIQWRSQPLVQGLARLARELENALGDGGIASTGSLPEACARLEHVVHVSEEASHRTLDLIQECGVLLGTLPDAAADEQAATVAAIRSRMSEMTAAQGYQDLTGQIIRRVVDLVRAVHAGLGEATDASATPLQLNNTRGFGPSVAGVDPTPATQDDANELLSSLGL